MRVDHETSMADRLAEARKMVRGLATHGRPERLDFILATGVMVALELVLNRFDNRVGDPMTARIIKAEMGRLVGELDAEHRRLDRLAPLVPEYFI